MGELVPQEPQPDDYEIIEIPQPTGQYPRRVMMDARQVFNQDGPYIASRMMKLFKERLESDDPEVALGAVEIFAPWRKHFFKEQPQETLNVQAKLGEITGSALSDLNARVEALRGLPHKNTNQLPNGVSDSRPFVAPGPRLDPAREVRVSPPAPRAEPVPVGPRVNPPPSTGIRSTATHTPMGTIRSREVGQ